MVKDFVFFLVGLDPISGGLKPGLGDFRGLLVWLQWWVYLVRNLVFGWIPFGNELNPSQATLVAFELG